MFRLRRAYFQSAVKKRIPRKDSRYLHRGIATRSFERKFNLADHVEVVNAQLDNGLLKVSLVKEIPEAMKPRKIPVGSANPVIEKYCRSLI